ncbi:Putative ATP-dependent helicase IRC3 [Sporothrix eucalyptigena]|uniref:ATP-dependent helicase IRC3 n=1 Tax=Sporothrix eucalyptigena TaxID=1812306 RepID=A0ABP0BFK4_9PEZI
MLGPTRWRIAWRTISAISQPKRRQATTTAASEASQQLSKILLRDYQEECIQSVLASLRQGHKRLGVSLATGAGKTVIFTQLLDRIEPASPDADQTLILAHRRELVEQAARHCTRAYPDKIVEIEMGSLHASGVADITVASVQSITSGHRMAKFDPSRFKLVLVDEAHHIVAAGYMRVLTHFGLGDKVSCQQPGTPALVGVSATLSRFDGLALGAAIDEIVYHKDYLDMIGDGWLSNVIFTTVESTADLSKVRSGGLGKDFQAGELSRAVNTDQVNEITVRTWLGKAAAPRTVTNPMRRSTLVFCVDLNHVSDLTQKFRQFGVDAQFVTGDTDKRERGSRLEAFKRGEFPVLVNCGVFTEGTDMPSVDCVILARPTKSRNLLVQMIGRGMRLHEGKTNCHVIDMVSSLETGIVTTPTLFGLDPGELLSGASIEEMAALKEYRAAEAARDNVFKQGSLFTANRPGSPSTANQAAVTSVRFTEYDSVLDLISDTSGEKHIRALSQHSWVQVGKDRYVLTGPTGTYLRIEKMGIERDEALEGVIVPHDIKYEMAVRNGHEKQQPKCPFVVVEVRALPAGLSKSPYAAPREICRSLTLVEAVRGADTYASKIFPRTFIHRYQKWRKGPPSHGQLAFVNRIRGKEEEELTMDDIDRGTASDMITKIKHGARGQFSKLGAARRRQDSKAKALERDRLQRKREEVTVGPLSA